MNRLKVKPAAPPVASRSAPIFVSAGSAISMEIGGSAANAPRRIANAAPVVFSFMTDSSNRARQLVNSANVPSKIAMAVHVNPDSTEPSVGAV
jgi:hypothetical protein